MNYVDIMDEALHNFAKDGLKPNSDELSKSIKIIQGIFELLQNKSKAFRPARCIIGGSMGKATAIPGYDSDLVVFINEQIPPCDRILDDYENVLDLTEQFKITNLKRTKHSIQFEANGIEIDLLPAANFVTGMQNLGGDALAREQGARALLKIQELHRKNPGIIYNYSSSLVELHVLFMKQQSAFVHELARICKFWNKTLVLGDKVSGLSTIIELVATYAGNSEENNQSKPSTLRAFRKFLELMKNLDNMGIKFATDLKCVAPTFMRPFLVEPSNPFNNLLKNMDQGTIEKFKAFAAETLRRLENEVYALAKLGYFPLELLFEPQPKIIRSISTPKPTSLVGVSQSSRKNPNMIVRNEKKFPREIKDMLWRMKNTMFTAVHAFTSSGRSGILDEEVKAIVTGNIDRHLHGTEPTKWVPATTEKHDDYDVTFELPFADQPKIVRVSFMWD